MNAKMITRKKKKKIHTWEDCDKCEFLEEISVPSLVDGTIVYTCRFTKCILE